VLQGAGAISAAVIALASDLTRDEVRTKAMAIIGITIGVTFALSMVLGPVLGRWIGVPGIFALTGVLALGAIAVVRFRVPDPVAVVGIVPDRPRFADVLRDPQLARLNVGIFVLHAVLMALFVVVPFALRGAGLEGNEHWKVYLPVMLGAFVLMAPVMAMSERRGKQKPAFVGAVVLLAIAGTVVILITIALLYPLVQPIARVLIGVWLWRNADEDRIRDVGPDALAARPLQPASGST